MGQRTTGVQEGSCLLGQGRECWAPLLEHILGACRQHGSREKGASQIQETFVSLFHLRWQLRCEATRSILWHWLVGVWSAPGCVWTLVDRYQCGVLSTPPPALLTLGAGPGCWEFCFIMQEPLRESTPFCFLQVSKQG